MEPSELALFTTRELIEELTRRTTFLGVVVHSEKDYRAPSWGPERVFKVQFNSNLSAPQAGRLLGTIAEHLDRTQPEVE